MRKDFVFSNKDHGYNELLNLVYDLRPERAIYIEADERIVFLKGESIVAYVKAKKIRAMAVVELLRL